MSGEPEAWLGGPIEGVTPHLMPVAHALVQVGRDVGPAAELSTDDLWARPGGAASVGFHLTHVAGVLDRLLTYARGEALSQPQIEASAPRGPARRAARGRRRARARDARGHRPRARAGSLDSAGVAARASRSRAPEAAEQRARPPLPRSRARDAPHGPGAHDRQDRRGARARGRAFACLGTSRVGYPRGPSNQGDADDESPVGRRRDAGCGGSAGGRRTGSGAIRKGRRSAVRQRLRPRFLPGRQLDPDTEAQHP